MEDIKKEKIILVTGVGGDIGQGIIKCLKELDYDDKIIGCDIDNYAAGKVLVDVFINSPRATEEDIYIQFIKRIVENNNIRYIIPSSEPEIKVFNKYRRYFEEKNIKLLINNEFIINTFLDKYKTSKFFMENNLPYPRTYPITEFKNQLSFPVVLKLKESAGSKGVFLIHDNDELKYFRKRYNDCIIQEYIGNVDNEYTIGVFSDGENIHSIAFRRYLGLGSLSRYVELINDTKIKELAEEIATITKLRGSINIQVRKEKEKYVVFEINPRISSTVYFRHYFGFEDIKWWVDIMDKKPIEYTPKYTKGIGVKTLGEVFFDLEI